MIKSTTVLIAVLAVVVWYYRTKFFTKDQLLKVQLNRTYDYIVVGAGSAGSVIANRLSEDPNVTVLLLEAGGSELNNDNIRIPLFAGMLLQTEVDWAYYTVPQKHSHWAMNDQSSYWARGKVLGGSSSTNYMVYTRGSRHDYDKWEKEGCTGWGYKDVLPYFLKIEDVQIPHLYNSPYHSRGGSLPISESPFTQLIDIFNEAAKEIGEHLVDINGQDQIGYSNVQSNIKNGERQSTATTYIRPIVHRPNLHISLHTMATKILIEDKRAIGVEAIKNNRKMEIFAGKEVISSAGSINSAHLLMLSGIGPKDHLQDLGIPVVSDLPVGSSLEEHMMFSMKYTINQSYAFTVEKLNFWNNLWYELTGKGWQTITAEGIVYGQTENREMDAPPYADYQLMMLPMAQDKGFIEYGLKLNYKKEMIDRLKTRGSSNEFSIICEVLHPKSKGSIRLKSPDPFDYPEIDPHYLEDPADVKVLISAIRKSQKLASTMALQQIGATINRYDFDGICNKEKFDTDSYWECILRNFAYTGFHASSSCKMGGKSDKTAVVDPELRVKGIKGLRVADLSVLRNVPSGNTNAPAIMIGEKAADVIRGKDTVGLFRERINKLKL